MKTGLIACWFMNLIVLFAILASLLIGYILKVDGSQDLVDTVLRIATITTMVFLSVMGFIVAF